MKIIKENLKLHWHCKIISFPFSKVELHITLIKRKLNFINLIFYLYYKCILLWD